MSFNGSIINNQNIQVVVRCRPPNPHEHETVLNLTDTEVKLSKFEKAFTFDHVFDDNCSQFDVYKTVAEPLINQVLQGFNCTIFAYGQTGTGKTYTMEGKYCESDIAWENDPFSGIIPRSLNHLFDVLSRHEEEFTVHVSFIELYNEEAYDLLSAPDDSSLTKLKIYDDANKKGSVIIGGLKETNVKSKSEIYNIFRLAASKRQTAATQLNACSSRSHTIFSVIVRLKEGGVDELLRVGKLNLVDLAGSECVGRSGAKANRAREAGSINQSLLTLGRVITALVEKAPHIPYRESKLTRILQDSLGGTTRTSIIATVSPAVTDLEDTCSTLEYAQRAKKITNKPVMNQQLKQERSSTEMCQEIRALHDRYQFELSTMEMRIRNEITDEWKAANSKLEHQYNESIKKMLDQHQLDLDKRFSELTAKDEEIANLEKEHKLSIQKLEDEHKLLIQKLEDQHSLLIQKLEEQHKLELDQHLTTITNLDRQLRINNEKLILQDERHQKREQMFEQKIAELESRIVDVVPELIPQEPSESKNPVQKRVRKVMPTLAESEYADITFDNSTDELAQFTKKNSRKRAIKTPQANGLSGKKRKIKQEDAGHLSPLEQPIARATRSRARKKLEFC